MIRYTENQRCHMLADYLEHMSIADIAVKYGCSRHYVQNLVYRSGYAHRTKQVQAERLWRKACEAAE